ncbi:MAG: hypothetical protein LBU32_17140 [Clostridiales bacterium]|nr:hypothetical protein [Clostridiales bacterium]
MKKSLSLILAAVLLAVLATGCGVETAPSPSNEVDAITADTADDTAANTAVGGAFTVSYEYKGEDANADWSADSATMITFTGSDANVSGSGAAFSKKY